ncbi:redoxin domain-containing protein [Mesorhizobium sp. NBSH29]|uniref:peroxiredoxin n=1 Tax=Mesorhizobium sp. NBSH29 TaxID=2654249 RepID=UPI00189649D3|nr:peroxiredoxin [Mesorhizobium sp. NBSH29]QPC87642.1 redoxin domain-containing protein [Mesorhizobium sp. NBSH29]
MAEVEVGHKAPDVQLSGEHETFQLANHSGKIVVIYFYPQDDTEGCTLEAIEFSRLKPDFEAIGASVVGVSPDNLKKHQKFRAKHHLTVDLLADEERNAIEAFGVWTEKQMFGRKYMGVERATFLINRVGMIAKIWRKVRVNGHAEAVLEAAKSL